MEENKDKGAPEVQEKKRWTARRKGMAAGVAAVAVVAAVGCGIAVASQAPQEAAEQPAQEQQEQKGLNLDIQAEGWTDDSSAMVAHLAGTASDGTEVDTYHAFTASGDRVLGIADGDYELSWVPAINADGSIFRAPEAQQVKVEGGRAEATSSFEQVPADQVTADDIGAILDGLTEAVAKGDSSLQGDAAKDVLDKAAGNAANCPNADKEAVEAKKDVAGAVTEAKSEGKDVSAAKQEAQAQHPAAKPSSGSSQPQASGTGSASSGSSSQASQSQPAQQHVHSWETRTRQEAQTVHHPATYKEVQVCKECGAYNPSSSHLEQHMLAGGKGGTYGKRVVDTPASTETVYKTVSYQVCTGCGATR